MYHHVDPGHRLGNALTGSEVTLDPVDIGRLIGLPGQDSDAVPVAREQPHDIPARWPVPPVTNTVFITETSPSSGLPAPTTQGRPL